MVVETKKTNQDPGNFFNSAVLHREAKLEQEKKRRGINGNFIVENYKENKKKNKKGVVDKVLDTKVTLPKMTIRNIAGRVFSIHDSGKKDDGFVKSLIRAGLV